MMAKWHFSLARRTPGGGWLRQFRRKRTRRNPSRHSGTGRLAVLAGLGIVGVGGHVAGTQGSLPRQAQQWLHQQWPKLYPAPGGRVTTPAPTGSGTPPPTGKAPSTGKQPPSTVDGGGRRWTGLIDLAEWGAPGFAWNVSSNAIVTIRENWLIGSLRDYPVDQRTPEKAAAIARDWYLRQLVDGQIGPVDERPTEPVDLGQLNPGAYGWAWDPVSGVIYGIDPPYDTIGQVDGQAAAVMIAMVHNGTAIELAPE